MGFQFGLIADLPMNVSCLGFILVIGFLILFQNITNTVEFIKDYYPSAYQMIQKLYKELMIMGLVSFSITMFDTSRNHNNTNSDWLLAIDLAHVCLFFMAIFDVVHVGVLIYQTISIAIKYQQTHYMELRNILHRIKSINSRWENFWYSHKFIPGTHLRRIVEFKISHKLFRECFSLPKSFNFPSYLSGCHEKYALAIMDVGVFHYVFLMCFSLVIYCIYLLLDRLHLGCTPEDGGVTRICIDLVELFIICGYVMIVSATAVLIISRIMELRMLSRVGATDIRDFEDILKHQMKEEENMKMMHERSPSIKPKFVASVSEKVLGANIKANADHHRRLLQRGIQKEVSLKSLKKNVEHQKKEKRQAQADKLSRFHDTLFMIDDFFMRGKGRLRSMINHSGRQHGRPSSEGNTGTDRDGVLSPPSFDPRTLSTLLSTFRGRSLDNVLPPEKSVQRGLSLRSSTQSMFSGIKPEALGKGHEERDIGKETKQEESTHSAEHGPNAVTTNTTSPLPAFAPRKKKSAISVYSGEKTIKSPVMDRSKSMVDFKKAEDFSDIYIFKNKNLFFRAVEVTVMMNSFWLALWATNFVTLAGRSNNSLIYQIAMLVPFVLMFPILDQIVRITSKLNALSELDFEVIGHVLEQDEAIGFLLKQLRESIEEKVFIFNSNRREVLDAMLDELGWRYNHNNVEISLDMFGRMLRLLHLHYSKVQTFHLFNVIDTNRSGSLTVDEIMSVVFPTEAEEEQKLRDEEALKQVAQKHLELELEKLEEEEENGPLSGRSTVATSARRRSVQYSIGVLHQLSSGIEPMQRRLSGGGRKPSQGLIFYRERRGSKENESSIRIRRGESKDNENSVRMRRMESRDHDGNNTRPSMGGRPTYLIGTSSRPNSRKFSHSLIGRNGELDRLTPGALKQKFERDNSSMNKFSVSGTPAPGTPAIVRGFSGIQSLSTFSSPQQAHHKVVAIDSLSPQVSKRRPDRDHVRRFSSSSRVSSVSSESEDDVDEGSGVGGGVVGFGGGGVVGSGDNNNNKEKNVHKENETSADDAITK